jgi:hypothetical protein
MPEKMGQALIDVADLVTAIGDGGDSIRKDFLSKAVNSLRSARGTFINSMAATVKIVNSA